MPKLTHLKIFQFFIPLILYYSANAEHYYLSNTGNDSNPGTSTSQAWKTLEKLNSFKLLSPGDSVLFKRGDTFYGSIRIVRTFGDPVTFGTRERPIIFSSYGIGSKPIITGFSRVAGWISKGGNIWESTNHLSVLETVSVVKVNGVNTPMGRFPNFGWRTIQSSTKMSITDSTLNSTNWTGAEIVTRKEKYIIDRDPIIGQRNGTINFSNVSGYSPRTNWGYFIQNDLRTLDSPNEWYYNGITKKLFIYSAKNPGKVEASSSETLITLIGYSKGGFVHINNLRLEGANKSAIDIGAFSNLSIENCDFKFCYTGIAGWNYNQASDSISIDNCTFNDIQDVAIVFPDEFTHAIITNNILQNVGNLVGMSGSGDYKACGMRVQGAYSLVQFNSIKNIGYHGIIFNGEGVVIKNNFIDNALTLKDDGGGIYTYQDFHKGKVIESNIVINCHGNNGGVPTSYLPNMTNAEGIYLDGWSSNIKVINNTVANIRKSGIMINLGDNISIRGNTIFNCFRQGIDIRDVINHTSHKATGLNVKNNIIVQKDKPIVDYYGTTYFNQLILFLVSANDDFASWGKIDSNYYGRPIDDSVVFNIQPDNSTWTKGKYYPKNLVEWQKYKGDDLNSKVAPVSIKNTSDVIFKYNATKSSVQEKISGTWIDMKGKIYADKVILQPYTSIILLKWNLKMKANASSGKRGRSPKNPVLHEGSKKDRS